MEERLKRVDSDCSIANPRTVDTLPITSNVPATASSAMRLPFSASLPAVDVFRTGNVLGTKLLRNYGGTLNKQGLSRLLTLIKSQIKTI